MKIILRNLRDLRDPLVLGRTGRKEICVNPWNQWDIDVLKTRNPLAISDISLIFAACKVLNIRIMRTFNYNEIQNTPIWNEVKNWSDDRKNALITLLYSTMKGINPYEVPEDKVQAFVNDMPHEVLEMASEYAIKESRSGRGLSHSQAMEKIKEQRGWK